MTTNPSDYDMSQYAQPPAMPPPPPSGPPPAAPPPAPAAYAPPAAPTAAPNGVPAAAPPLARPTVSEVTITARRVLFVEGAGTKGTKEVTVSLTGAPDAGHPASASADRLWVAVRAKAEQYITEWSS